VPVNKAFSSLSHTKKGEEREEECVLQLFVCEFALLLSVHK
jgi:hypothetical protein